MLQNCTYTTVKREYTEREKGDVVLLEEKVNTVYMIVTCQYGKLIRPI